MALLDPNKAGSTFFGHLHPLIASRVVREVAVAFVRTMNTEQNRATRGGRWWMRQAQKFSTVTVGGCGGAAGDISAVTAAEVAVSHGSTRAPDTLPANSLAPASPSERPNHTN